MKAYSLCISVQKLRAIKNLKTTVITHPASPNWENFYRRNPKRVRFFDQMMLEEVTFKVDSIEKQNVGRERIIRIKLKCL